MVQPVEIEQEVKKTEPVHIFDILKADISGENIEQYGGRMVVGPDEDDRFGRIGHAPGVFLDKVQTGVYRVVIPTGGKFSLCTIDVENNMISLGVDITSSKDAKYWWSRASATLGTVLKDNELFDFLIKTMVSQGQGEALIREGFILSPR